LHCGTEYHHLVYMHRIRYVVLSMFMLGLFLAPGAAAACTSYSQTVKNNEKSCCDDAQSGNHDAETCKKDCCSADAGEGSGCSGNCGHQSCQSSSPTYGVHQAAKHSDHVFNFEDKNPYPSYQQPDYSSGFYSIWQPPKIS